MPETRRRTLSICLMGAAIVLVGGALWMILHVPRRGPLRAASGGHESATGAPTLRGTAVERADAGAGVGENGSESGAEAAPTRQGVALVGQVVTAGTGRPVVGAQVFLAATAERDTAIGGGAVTDAEGCRLDSALPTLWVSTGRATSVRPNRRGLGRCEFKIDPATTGKDARLAVVMDLPAHGS